MAQQHIDDVKIEFVLSVYESIQGQIRQSDLKISLIISWVSITAILLGRQVADAVGARLVNAPSLSLVALTLIALSAAGVFIFGTLRPRTKRVSNPQFKGLLYNGDILRLAREPAERVKVYLEEIVAITTHEQIYAQFVDSIVSISEIAQVKNRMFLRALISTSCGFASLVALMAYVGAKASGMN